MIFKLSNGLVTTTLMLFTTFVLIACMPDDGSTISVADAHSAAADGRLTIIDIRTPSEWKQTGVGAGVETITMHRRDEKPGFTTAVLALLEGDKNAPIALICATGSRSVHMQRHLRNQGFTNVLSVSEGMLGRWFAPGWIAQGFPIEALVKAD